MEKTLVYLRNRHIKLGLVTNGEGAFQMKSIQALQIAGRFDGIFIFEWEGMAKPDPNLFRKAMAALGYSRMKVLLWVTTL
ncbi:HAD family hydrolase [Bacillus testis]|uniref:HAD family hydrolase n=1 Tax=Bacillus testis TaxID=1622072 RepID=UPI001E50E401|nr:HAD hydrolase-like protein [Bacillus testis]